MTKVNGVFEVYSRFYDVLYRDKNYAAEVRYIDALLIHHGILGNELLEFGSGTGRHGRLLAERGYRVTGIERSAAMVAQATEVAGFTCQQGDMCTVQLGRTFHAVLSLFHVMNYQLTDSDIHATFARATDHLESGGLFIFDVWYSPAVHFQAAEIREKRASDAVMEITRTATPVNFPNENRVDVNYTFLVRELATGRRQSFTETHALRHFSLPELDSLAEICGFERLAAEEFMTGNEPSENTWSVCVVLRRI